MKKIAAWLAAVSVIVFVIDWTVIGLKILDGHSDITIGAYIGLISIVIFLVCILSIKGTNRCPHCGKVRQSFGKYCPYCGKEIN